MGVAVYPRHIVSTASNNNLGVRSLLELCTEWIVQHLDDQKIRKRTDDVVRSVLFPVAVSLRLITEKNIGDLMAVDKTRRYLYLGGLFNLPEAALKIIPSRSPSLVTLDINCSNVGANTLGEIVRQSKALRSLCLNHCAEVNDTAVKDALLRLPGLLTLGLYACYQISDATVVELPQTSTMLTSLSLGYCQYLTDVAAQSLAQMPQLNDLDISYCSGISNEGVALILGSLRQLVSLSLEGLIGITPQTLANIAFHRSLTKLNLNDVGIEDVAMNTIIRGCPGITDLYLANSNLTDASVTFFPAFGKLSTLSLRRSSSVTDTSICPLADGCPLLRSLDLDGLPVTNRSMFKIASSQQLTSLNISFCREVTMDGVLLVATSVPTLRHLTMFGCTTINPNHILQRAPHIESIKPYLL
ncbi:leucine Rich Repeat family protein [Pelomyxa schiedti]|nr:leucine Rich Repeat family protein [Pelomyxa schiedti]